LGNDFSLLEDDSSDGEDEGTYILLWGKTALIFRLWYHRHLALVTIVVSIKSAWREEEHFDKESIDMRFSYS